MPNTFAILVFDGVEERIRRAGGGSCGRRGGRRGVAGRDRGGNPGSGAVRNGHEGPARLLGTHVRTLVPKLWREGVQPAIETMSARPSTDARTASGYVLASRLPRRMSTAFWSADMILSGVLPHWSRRPRDSYAGASRRSRGELAAAPPCRAADQAPSASMRAAHLHVGDPPIGRFVSKALVRRKIAFGVTLAILRSSCCRNQIKESRHDTQT